MLQDSTFWDLVAFVLFFALVFYLKVPGKVLGQLDERAARIKKDLDEAEKLHQDAQHLFAEYQRKQRNALKEAEEIVSAAEAEAKALLKDTEADLKASLERRRKQAEDKIAQAEKQAVQCRRPAAWRHGSSAACRTLRVTRTSRSP